VTTTPGHLLLKALDRWPDLGAEHTFLARLNSGMLDAATLDAFVPEDFYVACAALKKHSAAVAHITQLLDSQVKQLGHLRLRPSELDDVRLALAAELFVAPEPKRPRLERYSGVGPLGGWLRVVATRDALLWLRRHAREVTPDDDALLGELDSPAESPELVHLKARFSGQLSASFKKAIAGLEARQRNVLRQHYLDELTLEDLAALYHVHRATAARWLADAKAALLERTRNQLSDELGINRLEVDSIMRLVQSRLDLSAGIFLTHPQPRDN
jgi:RNA polymerase sigma-70 factor (ECF subfamily)